MRESVADYYKSFENVIEKNYSSLEQTAERKEFMKKIN